MQPLGLRSPRDHYHERPLPLSQLPRGAFSSFWKPLQGVGITSLPGSRAPHPNVVCTAPRTRQLPGPSSGLLEKQGAFPPRHGHLFQRSPTTHTHTHTSSSSTSGAHHHHHHHQVLIIIIIIIIRCSRWWVTSLGPCAIPQPHPSISFFSSTQFSRDEKAPDETLLKRLRSSAHQERVPLPEWIPCH